MNKKFDKIQECVSCGKKFETNNGECKYTLIGFIEENGKESESNGMWFCSDECYINFMNDPDRLVKTIDKLVKN